MDDTQTTIAAEPEVRASEEANVKRWTARVRAAREHWEPNFQQMRDDMEFVAGYQWDGQADLDDDRYKCNWTLEMVQQMVASLYAKNPEAEAMARPRLNFQLWDGSVEHLQDNMARMQQGTMVGMPDMAATATMQDFVEGRQLEAMVERMCKTLLYVYRYQVDTSKPEYKEQMKQAVRRAITCGVAYCRPIFISPEKQQLSTVETGHDQAALSARMASIMSNREMEDSDADMETLQSLAASMGLSMMAPDPFEVPTRVEFDFPSPTSIIPDTKCRSLKDFVSARWVAQEFILPVDEVNTFFGLTGENKIAVGKAGAKAYGRTGEEEPRRDDEGTQNDPFERNLVALWEVLDYTTKTHFFLVDGHKSYVLAPEPLWPAVSGFWPVFALTFNDNEADGRTKASIFPQSHVRLVRDAQKEWNRTRDALRSQRAANLPKYGTKKGQLSDADKEKLANAEPNSVIEFEGLPADVQAKDAYTVIQTAAIDPAVYDTTPLEKDRLLAVGMQQANLGPAQPDVTATNATIAEQSRLSVTSSNVDDLDGFLSRVAQGAGEMILQGFDAPTVERIVGRGAAWPSIDRADYLNGIVLRIKAASSGRPNQALRVANRERLMPVLLSAGANPIAIIEDIVKTLEDGRDSIDAQRYYPLPGQLMQPAGPESAGPSSKPAERPQRGGAPSAPQQPLQQLPSGSPVPLAAS